MWRQKEQFSNAAHHKHASRECLSSPLLCYGGVQQVASHGQCVGKLRLVLYEHTEGRVSTIVNSLFNSLPLRKLGKLWHVVYQSHGSRPDSH